MGKRRKRARAPEGALVLFTSATAEPVRGLVRIELTSGPVRIDGRARLSDAMRLYEGLGRAIDALVREGGEPLPMRESAH